MKRKCFLESIWVPLVLVSSVSGAGTDTRLVEAVKNRNSKAINILLHTAARNINDTDREGMTALLWAAHWDDFETAKALIAAGADVKSTNSYDRTTALHEASTFGDILLMEALLKAGADANATRGEGDTPLMVASRTGIPEAVKLLIEHGADVNARDNSAGQTPLMMAVAGNHASAAKVLLDHGANVDAVSKIFPVRHRPNVDATRKIDPPAGGMTALHFAAREGAVDAAKVLLEAGADINRSEGNISYTPLLLSVVNNHCALAAFLVEHGANVNDGSLYALMEMRSGTKNGRVFPTNFQQDSLKLAELMIEHGADINAVFNRKMPYEFYFTLVPKGTTAFFKAAETADVPAMKLLIAKGARPLPLADGTTPIMSLALLGSRDNPVATSLPPDSVLHETVEICMKFGFDVNTTNSAGNSALHYAAQSGSDSLVEYLVDHGARLDVKNKRGLSPLQLAQGKRGGTSGGESGGYGSDVPPIESTVSLIIRLTTQKTSLCFSANGSSCP